MKRTRSPYVYFGSAAIRPHHILSNFNGDVALCLRVPQDVTAAMRDTCPELDTWLEGIPQLTFPSLEHAWQALSKAGDRPTFLAFSHGGKVAEPTPLVWRVDGLGEEEAARKLAWWMRDQKNNVGIVAKMAVHKARAAKLGLVLRPGRGEGEHSPVSLDLLQRVWADLLDLKFGQYAKARNVLLATGDMTLVELDRHGDKSFWGGCVSVGPIDELALDLGESVPTVHIKGKNTMGKFMMAARARANAKERKKARLE